MRVDDGRVDRRGDLGDPRGRFGGEPSDHERHAWLGDSGFFESDVGERVAKVPFVIERDRGDRGDRRSQHVGGVEPPAEADFHDGDVDGRAPEDLKRDRGRHFEEGRLHAERAARDRGIDGIEDARR